MKILKTTVVIAIVVLALFYTFGSFMNAETNIGKWDEDNRKILFGVGLAVIVFASCMVALDNTTTKS